MAKRKRTQSVQAQLASDGALCVTFVNTRRERRRTLDSYDDLLAWSVEAGALGSDQVPRLERAAAERPGDAGRVVRKTQTLRRRLERMFAALAEGGKPAGDDFAAFNAELGKALAARRLVAVASGFRWSWGEAEGDTDRMLWPVLLSAADLLASPDHRRVRRCPHDDCGLLFVARGAGRPRKWCSQACRDRATSLKHYHATVKPKRKKVQRRARRGRQRKRLAGFDDA